MYNVKNVGMGRCSNHLNSPPRAVNSRRKQRKPREIVYTEDRIPVRTLHFRMNTNAVNRQALKNHFQQFGAVEHFSMFYKVNSCYGFVRYRSVYNASSTLNDKRHYIQGNKIRLYVADSWHQPQTSRCSDGKLKRPSDGQRSGLEPMQLLDLNDDCFYEIFERLNLVDLISMARTCVRFQQLALETFRRIHTAVNLTQTNLPGHSNIGVPEMTLFQSRNLFLGFGRYIQKLELAALSFKPENRYRVLQLVMSKCSALKSLNLTGFNIKESLYRNNNAFFANLEELSFSLCGINDSIKCAFRHCTQLRKLTIQSDSNLIGSCLTLHFPRLESITLIMNSDIETRHVYTFFQLNRQLKHVKIIHCGGCIIDEIFEQIANYLPELESLFVEIDYFQNFSKNIMELLRLQHLRELQFNCGMYSITSFVEELAAKNKIEVLYISGGLFTDSLIEAIAKCKKLTSLKLCSIPSVHNKFLSELARSLPALNDFHISKCQTLNATGLVQFVCLAKKLKSLHINNSSVEIDDEFFQNLAKIYKERASHLTLSLSKIPVRISAAILAEEKQFVEVVQPNTHHLYDLFGDESSDMDSEYDDSDSDSWSDFSNFENFMPDNHINMLDFNIDQWNFFIP